MALIKLENEYVSATLNTKAGYIESLFSKKDGQEHAWQYDSSVWPRRTAVCFPLCGKCRDDRYSAEGKEYELPNHGFLRERDLRVVSSDTTHLVLEDIWDETTLARYPFRYSYRIEYSLSGSSLLIAYRVKNLGDSRMYYSTGSHYTYALPGKQEECFVYFEKTEKAGAFSQKDGSVKGNAVSGDRLSLKGVIDSSSLILDLDTLSSSTFGVGDGSGVFTRIKGDGFRYLIIWAPQGGGNDFVCIEFWDGMGQVETDGSDIKKKTGIRVLEKGAEREYLQTVTLM